MADPGWESGAPPRGAFAHLRAADPVMGRLVDELGTRPLTRSGSRPAPDDHYGALVREVVGQQLSGHAAAAIYRRLTSLFGGRPPSPEEVLASDPDELRAAAGLSRAKVATLRSIAEHVRDGSLELDRFDELDDEQIEAELVAVRGIGPWTAHMHLIFHLRRPDVLAPGDLGIRKAVQLHYGLPELPDPEQLERVAEPWRPHRSTACLLLWRSLDGPPAVPATRSQTA